MSETIKTEYEKYEEKETAELCNFYLLTFSPNPDRDTVKIMIPASGFTTTMRRGRFISIIDSLTDNRLHSVLKTVCNYYGGYFMIDRKLCECKPLSNLRDPTNQAVKQIQDEKRRLERCTNRNSQPDFLSYSTVLQKQMDGIFRFNVFGRR